MEETTFRMWSVTVNALNTESRIADKLGREMHLKNVESYK